MQPDVSVRDFSKSFIQNCLHCEEALSPATTHLRLGLFLNGEELAASWAER
jgi:hypothetical protein